MISYFEALKLIVAHVRQPLDVELKAIADCFDSICAEEIICDCYISPFDNSAMDGFAVRHADLQCRLNVVGSSFAGDVASAGGGGAWEIMTGAPVPDGYDTVVKIEDVEILQRDETGRPLEIELKVDLSGVELGNNIRRAGQDFKPDDVVIAKGEIVNAAHIAALATVGVAQMRTFRLAKIALMSTGKEIIDDAGQKLESGQIRNSNGPSLMATLSQMNVDAVYAGTIADEIDEYENCLMGQLNGADIIISTGAVSMGRHDFIPDSLRKLGAEIIFHKVKIRPGKPVLFAVFPPSETNPNGTYYFGLPGNPISANVGLRFFVSALLRLMQGLEAELPVKAHLKCEMLKKHDFKMFYKAFATLEQGKLRVEILQGQESFKIKPLLTSNCWAVLNEDDHELEADSLVDVYPMINNCWNF